MVDMRNAAVNRIFLCVGKQMKGSQKETEFYQCLDLVTGLFHRAIAQSGSALNPWAFDDPQVARKKAFRFAEALGRNTADSNELVEFLMKVPARRLVEGMELALTEEVSSVPKHKLFYTHHGFL